MCGRIIDIEYVDRFVAKGINPDYVYIYGIKADPVPTWEDPLEINIKALDEKGRIQISTDLMFKLVSGIILINLNDLDYSIQSTSSIYNFLNVAYELGIPYINCNDYYIYERRGKIRGLKETSKLISIDTINKIESKLLSDASSITLKNSSQVTMSYIRLLQAMINLKAALYVNEYQSNNTTEQTLCDKYTKLKLDTYWMFFEKTLRDMKGIGNSNSEIYTWETNYSKNKEKLIDTRFENGYYTESLKKIIELQHNLQEQNKLFNTVTKNESTNEVIVTTSDILQSEVGKYFNYEIGLLTTVEKFKQGKRSQLSRVLLADENY
jgi:hypothetical protein